MFSTIHTAMFALAAKRQIPAASDTQIASAIEFCEIMIDDLDESEESFDYHGCLSSILHALEYRLEEDAEYEAKRNREASYVDLVTA